MYRPSLPQGVRGRSVLVAVFILGLVALLGLNFGLVYDSRQGQISNGFQPVSTIDEPTDRLVQQNSSDIDPDNNPRISFNIAALDPPPPEQAVPLQGRNVITSAIFTSGYTPFALMLGYSIQKHNNISDYNAEMVLMILPKSPTQPDGVTKEDVSQLHKAGWKVRDVEPLRWDNVDQTQITPNHRYNLNKLQVWNWTEYDRVLFIDADCVVKSGFADLFRVPGPLAAASDILGEDFITDSFNSGVMSLRPSREIFEDYMKKVPVMHRPDQGDQPFLQEYWALRYWQLPRKYNFNIAMWRSNRAVWSKLWPEASIVHFAAWKPGRSWCREGCDYSGPMMWFTEGFVEMLDAYGLTGKIPVWG